MNHPPHPLTARLVDLDRFRAGIAARTAADPIGTNVMATAVGRPDAASIPDATWILVHSADHEVVAAAFRTPPFPVNLPAMPDAAVGAVARLLHEHGFTVTGLSGDVRATRLFASLWEGLTGARGRCVIDLGTHVLGDLVPPSGVPGAARVATLDDAALVQAWFTAFETAVHGRPPRQTDPSALERRLAARLVLLWEDRGDPVSLAAWHPPAVGVSRIGPVHTPVEHRRRGYAAAVTAAAARSALAAGAEHVMLFTDLANPTPNGVYARLGFRRVGDASEWSITSSTPSRTPIPTPTP